MGFRTFTDREGRRWEIRDRSDREWDFVPDKGNPGPARVVERPDYETDPYELSSEELQRLLDAAPAARARERKSPFKD